MINTKNLIIGFDPGLINTGWGVLEKYDNLEKYVDHGCITTSKTNQLGERLKLIYDNTLILVRKYSPQSIAVEKIFANKNPESTMKLGKARAIIFLVAAKRVLIGNNNIKAEKPKILINFLFSNCIKLV